MRQMNSGKLCIGIITIATAGGWRTVRSRWEKLFQQQEQYDVFYYHIEDYAHRIKRLTVDKHRLRTLWYLAAGREAVKQALTDGCNAILINTFHNAAWIPLRKNVQYTIYGDATARQIVAQQPLQTNRWSEAGILPPPIDWLYKKGIARLVKHKVLFAGMSQWYLKDLHTHYRIPETQTALLTFGLELDSWSTERSYYPRSGSPDSLDILFIGTPFAAKGGNLVLELAEIPEFTGCRFHLIAPDVPDVQIPNCTTYAHLQSDTPELRAVFSACDVLILPTSADCSPHVAIEAQAMGLPVIITDIGGTGEIVLHGSTGSLMPHPPALPAFAKALSSYLHNPDKLARESREAAKHAAAMYNIDDHEKRLYGYLTRGKA